MAVEVNEANRESCLCPNCPTYTECMTVEEESLFCGTSVTMCEEVVPHGCVCGRCDVRAEYDLLGSYFCMEGPVE